MRRHVTALILTFSVVACSSRFVCLCVCVCECVYVCVRHIYIQTGIHTCSCRVPRKTAESTGRVNPTNKTAIVSPSGRCELSASLLPSWFCPSSRCSRPRRCDRHSFSLVLTPSLDPSPSPVIRSGQLCAPFLPDLERCTTTASLLGRGAHGRQRHNNVLRAPAGCVRRDARAQGRPGAPERRVAPALWRARARTHTHAPLRARAHTHTHTCISITDIDRQSDTQANIQTERKISDMQLKFRNLAQSLPHRQLD